MRTLTLWMGALAVATLAAFTTPARAGDAVRLVVEPPKDVTTVETGDPGIDVQIVGIDAVGVRVAFGDKKVETSATEGELVLVTAPYKYRYIPPATIEQPVNVTLRAWLKQSPDVKGEASIQVVARRPFERLALVAPSTSLQLGTSMEIEVRGVRSDGTSGTVKGQEIVFTSEGVGTVEQMSATVFRYVAPAKSETRYAGATAHLRAHLKQYRSVAGELSVILVAEPPPPSPGGSTPPVPVPPTPKPPVPNPNPGPIPPAPAPAPPPGSSEDGVLWPSGNVKLLVWRTKHNRLDEWPTKEREDIAGPGKPLIARGTYHRLRVEIERGDVVKVELEWYVGEKKGAPVHVDDADKDGRLRTEINKAGKKCAILEFETPDEKPLYLNLLLTTQKGEVLKEEFVVQRGRDKNDDGSKDGRKKK